MLKLLLEEHLNTIENRESTPGYLSVTDLYEMCPRAIGLHRKLKIPREQSISAGLRIVFSVGRSVDDFLKQQLCELKVFRGQCECRNCIDIDSGFLICWDKPMPVRCPRCGGNTNVIESHFTDENVKIRARTDGFISENGSPLELVEFKYISPNMFPSLREPLAKHKFQVNCYLRLIKDWSFSPGHIPPEGTPFRTDRARILYVCMGFNYGSPFKEFTIPYDKTLADYAWAEAKKARGSELRLPKRELCQSIEDKRARGCAMARYCFSKKISK